MDYTSSEYKIHMIHNAMAGQTMHALYMEHMLDEDTARWICLDDCTIDLTSPKDVKSSVLYYAYVYTHALYVLFCIRISNT